MEAHYRAWNQYSILVESSLPKIEIEKIAGAGPEQGKRDKSGTES
jgi:hypothetical protein